MAGKFIKHIPCKECGSRDNNGIYLNEDGTHSSYCFGCESTKQKVDIEGIAEPKVIKQENDIMSEKLITVDQINDLPSLGLRERGIVKVVAEHYGMKVAKRGIEDVVTHHYYPYTKDGIVVGYQERVVADKRFMGIGYAKNDIELQGQHLWANGGAKSLVITEGFLDTLAASQMLSGKRGSDKRYPVVSLPNGANIKCIAKNLDWINSFERVVLMLDQDEPGKRVARDIANIIRPGHAFIAKFSSKDASDMLTDGKEEEFRGAYWNAQKYSPSDIVTAAEAREILSKENEVPSIPYPDFAGELNMMEYGKRMGEITVFTSGTGMGKSQFLKEDLLYLMNNTELKVGVVSLEESTRDTLMGLQSLYLNKRIHLPDVNVLDSEREESIKWLEEECGDRLVMLDHQGASVSEELMDKIRYLVAIGCDYIYIDHITIAVSGELNQNQAIDMFMESLLKMAKRHQVWFGVVSHLRKTGGDKKSFEAGGIPTDDDLKGSGSIKQIAFTIIALVRNKMSKTKSSETKMYVLKSRYTGRTGYAGSYTFDKITGRLKPLDDPMTDNEEDDDEFTTF